jgi:hypothetical protein
MIEQGTLVTTSVQLWRAKRTGSVGHAYPLLLTLWRLSGVLKALTASRSKNSKKKPSSAGKAIEQNLISHRYRARHDEDALLR